MLNAHRRLAWSAATVAWLLIVLGAVVRITGSGLGCGNHWPLCNGRLLPPLDLPTIIEYGHRLVAAAVSGLVFALAIVTWRLRMAGSRQPYAPSRAGYLALALLIVQVALGAITVKLDLPPWTIILHLGTAMLLFATLLYAGKAPLAPGVSPGLAKPPAPFTPRTPITPITPITPGIPGSRFTPGIPGSPFTPGTPGSPFTPGTPITPITPGTPFTPGTPTTPITPGTPGSPITPGSPFTPGLRPGLVNLPITPITPGLRPGLVGALVLALVFVTLLFGALTANLGAASACLGFPLCNGQVIPDGNRFQWIQWTHRLLAYSLLIATVAWAWKSPRRGPKWVLALVLTQVGVAAAMVLLSLPESLRVLHVAVGAAVWGAAVLATLAVPERPDGHLDD